jgi:hypothetical protein
LTISLAEGHGLMTAESGRNGTEKQTPSVLISHPTGNENVRNALRSLVEHDMLAEFWTAVAWDPQSPWNRLLPSGLRIQLSRRAFAGVPKAQVHCVPWREMMRLGTRSSPLAKPLCSGERPFSFIGMYRSLDRRVARCLARVGADVAYAYEGGALETFRAAKHHGVAAYCEMQSSHWRWWQTLLREEAECNPEFAGLLPQLKDTTRHFEQKDEELLLADLVFVPSQHVKSTLSGLVPEEKVRVISYGAPVVKPRRPIAKEPSRALKVLFVGALGQNKGIGYLLDAIDRLGAQVDLTLVGRRVGNHPRVDEACSRWDWFDSLPNTGVLELMQRADVLVLPSLAEGCSLVTLEAIACGLPVIVTPNTGTLEFVRDGCEGFIVPIRSADAIAECLNTLNSHRELLATMSSNAQKTAQANSWEQYRATWANALKAGSRR